jgi:prepilin-type N-terminal cleavage/methylation domain-containing protein
VTTGARPSARDRSNEGFTLIELVVAMLILPIVLGAIATAIIFTYRNSGTTKARMADSLNAQLSAAFFARDVDGAQYLMTVGTVTAPYSQASPQLCVNPALSAPTLVLGLYRPPNTATGVGTSSSALSIGYWLVPGSPAQLVRDACSVSTASWASTYVDQAVMSDDVSGVPSVAVTPGSFAASAAAGGWVGTATASVSVSSINLSVAQPGSSFAYSLTAVPRFSNPALVQGQGSANAAALVVLGTLDMGSSGSATINVTGDADVDNGITTQGGESVSVSGGIFGSGQITCASGTTVSAGAHNVCGATLTGGAPTDPLASFLPAPAPTSVGTLRSCPTVPSSGSITLQPGSYGTAAAPCELNASGHGGGIVYLEPGVYEFTGGVSVGNGNSVQMAPDAGTNGALLYLPNLGASNETFQDTKGGTSGCNICITPLTAAQSAAAFNGNTALQGLWLWQATSTPTACGANGEDIIEGGDLASSQTGTAYLPSATINFNGGGTVDVANFIAQDLCLSGGTSLAATGR